MSADAHARAQARIEGLRNLRTGYDLVAAVWYWQSLHGEDLIDEYAALAAELAAVTERAKTAEERVAEALYERAMSERRAFSREPQKFARGWRAEPYVPPVGEGESRPTNWRDGWRDEARAVLSARPTEDTQPNRSAGRADA